jgi:WD40 repeat protein
MDHHRFYPRARRALRLGLVVGAATAALAGTVALAAQGKQGLTQVWSRMADIGGELGSVESAEFSPDSRFIVTGTKFDSTVVMWRTSDGTEVWRQDLPQEIERVGWTRDGAHVASVSEEGLLRLFRASDGELVRSYQHESSIDALAASPDGRFFATGQETQGRGGPPGAILTLLTVPELTVVRKITLGDTINNVDFSSDGRLLASADMTGAVSLFSTTDWLPVRTLRIPPRPQGLEGDWGLVATRFSPDGQYIAAGGFSGDVYVWRVADGELMRRFNQTGRKIESIDWTKDSRFLVTAGHETAIRFFPLADILNKEVQVDSIRTSLYVPVSDTMEYLRFNNTGALLATAHQDGTVQLWTYFTDDPGLMHRLHLELGRKERAEREAAARSATPEPTR